MIISRLNGGLGNQLFQYAMGRRTAHGTGLPLKLDIEKFKDCGLRNYRLDHFNINASIATREDKLRLHILRRKDPIALLNAILDKFRPIHRQRVIREPTFRFNPKLLNIAGPTYLDGDWQSPRYFEDIGSILRQEITLKTPLGKKDQSVEKEILAAPDSVSVHIRRGDLVSDPKTNQMHGTIGLDYYSESLRQMNEKLSSPIFFLFSDEPAWAIENLPAVNLDIRHIGHNGPDKDYADLHLMSQCRHHVLANSTFSWWAAWLAKDPDKIVIYPRSWFRAGHHDPVDIFLSSWNSIG
jgi:hypothetical protein